MNKGEIIKKIACWVFYCLFAGYSAWMTTKSIAMSLGFNQTLWSLLLVYVFVFAVAVLAGYCLSITVGEMGNHSNPSNVKFSLALLGFLLFWGVSFATNVHYLLMSKKGLEVVSAETGHYKNYVDRVTNIKADEISDERESALKDLRQKQFDLKNEFWDEVHKSHDKGFGTVAISILEKIEDYLNTTASIYNDDYNYTGTIWIEGVDKAYKGQGQGSETDEKAKKQRTAIIDHFTQRIDKMCEYRETAINNFYDKKINELNSLKDYTQLRKYINDSLYGVYLPMTAQEASPEAYYNYQKYQLHGKVHDKLVADDQIVVLSLMKESKTGNPQDIEKGKFRYRIYPSDRMFETFNVWGDMLQGRMPSNMSMLFWIFVSFIIDLVAFIFRVLAR